MSELLENENVPAANSNFKKWIKKTWWIFLVVLLFLIPAILSIAFNKVPEDIGNNQVGYKIAYEFDLLPTMFSLIRDDSTLSEYVKFGLFILLITPIVKIVLNFFLVRQKTMNEREQLLIQRMEIRNQQKKISQTRNEKPKDINMNELP